MVGIVPTQVESPMNGMMMIDIVVIVMTLLLWVLLYWPSLFPLSWERMILFIKKQKKLPYWVFQPWSFNPFLNLDINVQVKILDFPSYMSSKWYSNWWKYATMITEFSNPFSIERASLYTSLLLHLFIQIPQILFLQ